jgi:hypothetical protein
VVRNWVADAVARGMFEGRSGFRRLGFLLDECDPEVGKLFIDTLASAGISGSKLSLFTIRGCNPQSPQDVAQAIAQHRRDNVSHVLLASEPSDAQNYVRQADGIGFHPQYLVSDIGTNTAAALQGQWPDGFEKAIAITTSRTGERNSGIVSSPVNECNEWMKKSGVAPSTEEKDQIPPLVCEMFRLFVAATNATGPNNLTRLTLVDQGLPKIGHFTGLVSADSEYNRRGKVTGGDYSRTIQWHADCTCWKVLDREMRGLR